MGADDDQWQNFSDIFFDKLTDVGNAAKLIASTTWVGELAFGSTIDQLEKLAVDSLREAGISTYNKNQINSMVRSLASVLFGFAISHPNLTTTLICNLDSVSSAHYPELCLAWMQSRDLNYTSNAFWSGTTGSYRIVRINCPVDVQVFTGNGELVAAIISDEPQIIGDSFITSAINGDGEKLIYLLADADYSLKITATGNGEMNFSVNEYCFELGEVARVLNYYSIPITTGMTFDGFVPAFSSNDIENGTSNGSSVKYTLSTNGNEIKPDNELTGDSATEAYFMIEVVAANSKQGIVTGRGIRQLGNFAQVNAIAYDGCEFEGWYINNVKISSDAEYRFIVKEDVTLVAKFIGDPPIQPESGIKITGFSTGNGQANVDFNIKSANGKGYTVYLSETGLANSFTPYNDVNYNSKGVHIKGLTNGKQYYVYIEYKDDKGTIIKSDVVSFTPNK